MGNRSLYVIFLFKICFYNILCISLKLFQFSFRDMRGIFTYVFMKATGKTSHADCNKCRSQQYVA